jgi:hypothetical protein
MCSVIDRVKLKIFTMAEMDTYYASTPKTRHRCQNKWIRNKGNGYIFE